MRHANEAIRALEAFVLAADGCERKGRAGGYAIHGIAGSFVVKLAGSYTNVVGLPLTEVVSLLQGEGFPKPRGFSDPFAEGSLVNWSKR